MTSRDGRARSASRRVGVAWRALSSALSFSGVQWSVLLMGMLYCSNPVSVRLHRLHLEMTLSLMLAGTALPWALLHLILE